MEVSLIYPHQLYKNHPAVNDQRRVFFIEEPLLYGRDHKWPLKHHARRLALLKQAGDRYVRQLSDAGYDVEVIGLEDKLNGENKITTSDMLDLLPSEVKTIHVARAVDYLLERRVESWARKGDVQIEWHDTPNFLTPNDWWRDHFAGKKKPFMAHFYQAQRKRMGILVDANNKPKGGQWSYDEDNRKKLPKNYSEPKLPETEPFSEQTKSWVSMCFPDAWGDVGDGLPHTHQQAEAWLESFLKDRFKLFGDYEDAISMNHGTQQHSLLTPMMNIGLLNPQLVVDRALEFGEANDVPLNSLEGFVRQVIGWREFMRCMYELHGRDMRLENFWGFEHDVPESFYTGRTGLPPVDDAIHRLLKTGYCHHIERLMVLGVMFQLCHVKPTAVYRWFMEMFIDAYDWVMVPNVYGMSQFADGGKFVTKPYVCGSNYVRKMSDYPKGEWCDIWDGLFWDFIASNREFYQNQPRLGMMTRQLDKMDPEKLKNHRKNASAFRDKIHAGWQCDVDDLMLKS